MRRCARCRGCSGSWSPGTQAGGPRNFAGPASAPGAAAVVVPAPDRPGWLLAGLSPAVQGSRTALEGYRWLELNAEQNRGYRHMTTDQQEAMIDRLPMLLAQSHGILDDAIKRI